MIRPHLRHTVSIAKGKAVLDRTAKLALYKECLALGVSITDRKAAGITLRDVRREWRQNRGAGDEVMKVLIGATLDRIAYARMCLSKHSLRHIPNASEEYDWNVENPGEHLATRMRKRAEAVHSEIGDIGKGHRDFVPMTNWGGTGGAVMDPDVLKRNKELMDRQFFMGPHWRNRPKPMMVEELSFEEQMHVHFQGKPKFKKTPQKSF